MDESIDLDAMDKRILVALQESGRLSYEELGSKVGLSASAALRRVKRLEEAGVIAGYVALTGRFVNLADSQNISPRLPFRYNGEFDRQHNYQTRSVLAVPVRDPDGSVLGVLQLINRRDRSGKFCRFLPDHESLVSSLASLAAVALRYHEFRTGRGD